MQIVQSAQDEHYTLRIVVDEDAEDPRDDENLGRMICFHRRRILGDKHTFATPAELEKFIKRKDIISLPLFGLDHTEFHISTKDFGDKFDSGRLGHIFTTTAHAREWFGVTRIMKNVRKQVRDVLQAEVEMYDQYISGYVYGVILEKDDMEEISCWGFYGLDYAKSQLPDLLPEKAHHLIEQLQFV